MIISCPSCQKKFELDDNLLPENGRTLQCGSCNYKWFFKKKDEIKVKGIAHKIQTYQVVGSYKNIAQKRKILNEKFDGFNLNIDLNISKKNKVITSLENTLKQLKKDEKSN